MSKPKGPEQINCAHCGELFPRGSRAAHRVNFCSAACREAFEKENAKPTERFSDADAERVWRERGYAAQQEAYYSGFVRRPRVSTLYDGVAVGGAVRRNGLPCI